MEQEINQTISEEIEWTKAQLRDAVQGLKKSLDLALEELDRAPEYINEHGVVQSQGANVDMFCTKLHTLLRLQRRITNTNNQ